MRRDEARAAEEEKARDARALLAEQEARTALLRAKAKTRIEAEGGKLTDQERHELAALERVKRSPSRKQEHVNLFSDLEQGETTHKDNKEAQEEKKQEQEEYEKKIGLLTYLGQDTHELTGERSWWQKERPRDRDDDDGGGGDDEDKAGKRKEDLDPLKDVRRYLGCEGVQRYMGRTKRDMREAAKRKQDPSEGDDNDSRRTKKRKKDKKKKDKKKKKKKKKRKRESGSDSDESDYEALKKEVREEEEKEKLEKKRKLERMRAERLERERAERARANKVLYGNTGEEESKKKEEEEKEGREGKRKYNTQFNPQYAKQNKLDSSKKYWLE